MFFIFSKVLDFLLMPYWWIIFLLIWMSLSRSPRRKRVLLVCIISILILFTNPFIYRAMVAAWQPAPVELPDSARFEAGIVLGGMAGYDKNDRGYFGDNADRFIQTANLYHRGIIRKIIITGGIGTLNQEGKPEALFLRNSFIENGVNDSDIVVENKSRNTYENAVYSKRILDSLKIKPPYVLITSALHMRRSESVFKKAGYSFVAFPCDYKVNPQFFTIGHLRPRISLLDTWFYFIKEVVGLYVYKLTGKA
jgi:uncharacterized SAM-binding protein YcdF (DUF218 family)